MSWLLGFLGRIPLPLACVTQAVFRIVTMDARWRLCRSQTSSMQDLKSPSALWLKAILFLVIAAATAGMLWTEAPTLRNALLLGLLMWASCRAYYFAFYVIHHYADPSFRYSGLGSLVRHVWSRRREERTKP